MPKRILVTGGAGFLGSHLCEILVSDGHEVICLDNFVTGRRINILGLLENNRFQLIEHDVTKPFDIKGPIDQIYNLACPASPPKYQIDPIFTLKTSVIGSLNTLELAKNKNAIILQASTSEVYGDPEVHPQEELYRGSVNTVGIRSCYDEGKRAAETLFMDYYRHFGVSVKIMRIFNTYGPRMDPKDGRVVSNFVMQALRGEPLTIYGAGSQTRSFCFVDDLIRGMISLMNSSRNITGPINIGNPVEFTILELATLIQAKIGANAQLNFEPLPLDDPQQRKPDITLAKQTLGWSPVISLEQGLDSTVDYFKTEI